MRIGGKRVALAVPLTYMNDSGLAVAALARRYGVEPEQIVIVHDELDLPAGALKVKAGGGLAGHNGLRSIKPTCTPTPSCACASASASRSSKEQGVDHVLKRFSKRERTEIDVTLEQAADAVECIVDRRHRRRHEPLQLTIRVAARQSLMRVFPE